MQNVFRGLGVALVTPFNINGDIDYGALEKLIEYQIENGADFLCILATTGETPCLTSKEKNELTTFIKSVVKGRVPILKYCGGNHTAAVVDEIKTSDWQGIDGILSICPYYNKPSQEGLYQHFKAIAEISPLPIVLYNVPGRTGVNMKAETTVRIAKDFPNVVGIKEASGDLEQIDEIMKLKPTNFEVISGDDALTFPMIVSGAVGVISVIGNALPKEFSRMIRLELNGEFESARKIHHQFTELYKLLFVDGNPAGCKALLNDMGMIENVLRLPLVPTRIETKKKMDEILKGMRH
nr:4-hydroxy-tetrahydrodipicolinate synthase [uncultured Prevotella sp.]